MFPADPAPVAEDLINLSANVVRTAHTVVAVLESFGEGLRRGGFEEGIESYRRMADTVISQRLWTIHHRDGTADMAFAQISMKAGRISGLLREYVRVMDKLAAMDAVAAEATSAQERDADLPEPDRTIITLLAGRPEGATVTKIRSATDLQRAEITPALARLEERGRIRKNGATGRFVYVLIR